MFSVYLADTVEVMCLNVDCRVHILLKFENILAPAVTRSSDKIESIVRMHPRYVQKSENRIPEI